MERVNDTQLWGLNYQQKTFFQEYISNVVRLLSTIN